jgi:hypothetical protein
MPFSDEKILQSVASLALSHDSASCATNQRLATTDRIVATTLDADLYHIAVGHMSEKVGGSST